MKRIITVIAMLVAMGAVAIAGNIKVLSGDSKVFKNSQGASVVVEFVWDGATYDYEKPLEEEYENFEEMKPIAWDGFKEEFDDRSGLTVVKDESLAKYRIIIQVKNMDRYIKVMGFIPSPATKAWGLISIEDLESGETVTTIKFTEIDGGANPSPGGTFSDCFEELGKQVSKLK